MSCHDLYETWIIVKESCAYISLTHWRLSGSNSKKQVKLAGDRVRCSQCLITPSIFHNTFPSCPLNQPSDFLCTVYQVQTSYARVGILMLHLGQGPKHYPHQVLLASQSCCPWCGCCCMLTAWGATGESWAPCGEQRWKTLPWGNGCPPPEVLLHHYTPYTPQSYPHAYIHMCIHPDIHLCIHSYIDFCMYWYIDLCMFAYIHKYKNISVCLPPLIYPYIPTYVSMYNICKIHVYLHTYKQQACLPTYTHTVT